MTKIANKAASAKIEIPKWARAHLDEAGLARVAEAIGRAEARTSGEIVPMIVRGSSPAGHAGVLTFALVTLALWLLAPFAQEALAHAGLTAPLWALELGAFALAAIAGAFAPHSRAWLRMMIPRADRAANANRRAQLEFYVSRINSTEAHTGVLLFVSLLERRAVVLADAAIASRFPPDAWQDVVDLMLGGIRQGDFAKGFEAAIERVGQRLAEHFPAARHDRNELPNELIVRD